MLNISTEPWSPLTFEYIRITIPIFLQDLLRYILLSLAFGALYPGVASVYLHNLLPDTLSTLVVSSASQLPMEVQRAFQGLSRQMQVISYFYHLCLHGTHCLGSLAFSSLVVVALFSSLPKLMAHFLMAGSMWVNTDVLHFRFVASTRMSTFYMSRGFLEWLDFTWENHMISKDAHRVLLWIPVDFWNPCL